MNVGEYWTRKNGSPRTIKLIQFLGNDVWSCRHVIDGSDDDFFGNYIYNNFTKLEDPKKIQAYDTDFENYNKMFKKLVSKTLKKIREKK